MSSTGVTLGLLLLALGLDLALPAPQLERRTCEQLLGAPAKAIELEEGVAWQAADGRVALPFTAEGRQGLIRGVVVLAGGRIETLRITHQREGLDLRAMARPEWLERFRGRRVDGPVVVGPISGASISSRVVVDAVNARLRAWRARAG